MSLPPGFLDELRTRTSIAQVVGRKVLWDMRKSNQAKGDWWAPCPFHQEKSASFHVDDRKGYYYCFGCHAKGDALKFVCETENVGFMEAVEILAQEAGLTMPARDPGAARQADRRGALVGVMEEAVKWFRLQLGTAAGAKARAYLAQRRLSEGALARFEIGFAPDQRQGLFLALTGRGVAADLLVEAGLCARPEDGGAPYDRFRGRIIYPIRDGRGRCIGLGGRAMDPGAPAKYLNSPDTELFHKGRTLYNLGPAREGCGKGAALVVCEGYMDVIALVEAGFAGAVAPLGTAVTEEQLRLMWRIHPEPVIALDGDGAGVRAALRLIDLALPLLEAGNGLRFALMPEGQDPDELIRAGGREAMAAVIAGARPMADLIWRRATEGKVLDSPERRAALDKELRATIALIRDPSIRAHYGEEIRRLRADLFGLSAARGREAAPFAPRPARGAPFAPGAWPRRAAPAPPLAITKANPLVGAGPEIEEELREAMILGLLAVHPGLVGALEARLEAMVCTCEENDRLRHGLLGYAGAPAETARAGLRAQFGESLDRLLARPHLRSAPPIRTPADPALALRVLEDEMSRLEAMRAARAEVEEAVADLEGLADEGVTWRLSQVARARHRAEQPDLDEGGADESTAADRAALRAMIDAEIWRKPR